MRYVLTSNRSTLQKKDMFVKENNRYLSEKYSSKGLNIPPGKKKMRANNEKRLDDLLSKNVSLLLLISWGNN